MADRVDVKITAITPDGKKSNTNINYANPEADNSTLKTLAQKLNLLTRNTYDKSSKVETTNLDTAPDSDQQTPTLELSASTVSYATMTKTPAVTGTYNEGPTISYNGDGTLYAYVTAPAYWPALGPFIYTDETTTRLYIVIATPGIDLSSTVTIKVCATATVHYKAAEVEFTITA